MLQTPHASPPATVTTSGGGVLYPDTTCRSATTMMASSCSWEISLAPNPAAALSPPPRVIP
jgi:hypothetical protein